MAAPGAGRASPAERAGPLPDALCPRGQRQREPDVEAAEEPRGRADQAVVVDADTRERADPVPADAVRAPEAEHVELEGSLLAR